jgi:serine/threonine protein kinase
MGRVLWDSPSLEERVALRYQRQKLLEDHAGVKTYEGVDPLTGLPVLIYAFADKPHLLLNELESENIPGVLASQNELQQNYVVVAYAKGYKVASRPLEMDSLDFLIEGARALKDAAEIGVLHGDLRPERFWISKDHVLVEGFGLPWLPEESPYEPPEQLSSFAGDVYSWAKSALELSHPPPTAKHLLESCLVPQPNLRPSAEQIYTALVKIKTKPASVSTTGPAKVQAVGEPRVIPTAKTLEIDFNVSSYLLYSKTLRQLSQPCRECPNPRLKIAFQI